MQPADFSYSCTDKLDCACKTHDIEVFRNGGRTTSSDQNLTAKALAVAYNFKNPRVLRRKALLVAYGMLIGQSRRQL